jgi:hypothetical protein
VALFCQLWEQPEPGVVPDDDRLLASLARMAPETWTLARPQIARAFDTTSSPGFWLQKGLIETAIAQDAFVMQQSIAGSARMLRLTPEHRRSIAQAAALARWSKTKPKQTESVMPSDANVMLSPSVLGSRFSEESKKRQRAKKPRAPRQQLTHEELATTFGLPLALVKANAAKIHASGKYRNQYLTLVNWCKSDVENGRLEPDPNGVAVRDSIATHPDFIAGKNERERILRELS